MRSDLISCGSVTVRGWHCYSSADGARCLGTVPGATFPDGIRAARARFGPCWIREARVGGAADPLFPVGQSPADVARELGRVAWADYMQGTLETDPRSDDPAALAPLAERFGYSMPDDPPGAYLVEAYREGIEAARTSF